jgi:hypothetical protein
MIHLFNFIKNLKYDLFKLLIVNWIYQLDLPIMNGALAEDLHKKLNECGHNIIKEALAGKLEHLKTSATDGVNDVCIRELSDDQAERVTEYLKTDQPDIPGRFYVYRYTETVDMRDPFGDDPVVDKYQLRYIIDKSKEWSALGIIKDWWFPLVASAFFLSHLALSK